MMIHEMNLVHEIHELKIKDKAADAWAVVNRARMIYFATNRNSRNHKQQMKIL